MATFVTLMNYTAQGIASIKDSPSRLDAAREAFAPHGVVFKDFYLLMGEYDAMVVVEAPDATTVAKALIATGAQGNVSTTTMMALGEDEFREVVNSLD